jgi:Ca-activated chloride channel homolog
MKGQVKDDAGGFLQNVSILLHSNGNLYNSGEEGAFGIIANRPADTITFSFEGYQTVTVPIESSSFLEVHLKKLPYSVTHTSKLASLTQNLRRETQQKWFTGNETYASIIENQFIEAATYPSTGITLNVDRASYSNIRRFLKMKTFVPPDAVRIEEMLNYFNINYREPDGHKTFAIRAQLTDCPWNSAHQLLFAQVTSKKLSLDSLPPGHFVFLIDVSGSMDMPNRLPLLKASFKSLVNNLRTQDSVSIVVYGGTVGIALPTTGGNEKDRILRAIDSLQPGGSTPGESGIKLAYSVARNHFIRKGNNRVILATDGDFNVGVRSDEELEDLISRQRVYGIYLTCLGVGMGNYKDSKIQTLAKRGNGNFAYIDSYFEAQKVLLQEFTQTLYTVADNAYLNVQFDTACVKGYRLLGFDNKVGAIKDSLAQIEGGEIGPAYSNLIAFEISPAMDLSEVKDTDRAFKPFSILLQYREPGKKEVMEVREVPEIHYTPFSQLDSCYRFATAVILFGAKLKHSRFTKNVKWNEIMKMATHAADQKNFSQREFISLVQQAKAIYGHRHRREE